MKHIRFFIALMATLTIVFSPAIAGCSSRTPGHSNSTSQSDPFRGTWLVSSGEIEGVEYTAQDLADAGLGLTVTFGKDNRAYLTIAGDTVCDEYSVSGKTATIIDALDGTKTPFTLNGDELVLDYSEIAWGNSDYDSETDIVLRFERSGLNDGEAAADFNFEGNWIGVEKWPTSDPDNVSLLENMGAQMSISLNENSRGSMHVAINGQSASKEIYLEPSERTDAFLVKKRSDGSTFGILSIAKSGNTDWIIVADVDENGMSVSYRRE